MDTLLRNTYRSLIALGLILGLTGGAAPLEAIEGELLIAAPFYELIKIEDIATGASTSAFSTCEPPYTWQQGVGRTSLLGSCSASSQIPAGWAKVNRTYRISTFDSWTHSRLRP